MELTTHRHIIVGSTGGCYLTVGVVSFNTCTASAPPGTLFGVFSCWVEAGLRIGLD